MTELTLIAELKKHFVDAGFIDSGDLMADIKTTIPEGVLVMHNSYALMAGCEVLSEEGELVRGLIDTKEEMHSFIRQALLALENEKGLIVDGYLLLILKQAPETKTAEIVREIELDTKVCRKHIVWPLAGSSKLDRLQFITILSLPEPLHGNSPTTTHFELSAEASELLSEYERLRSLDQLMNSIKNGKVSDASRST